MTPTFRLGEVSTSRGLRTILFVSVPGLHRPLETGEQTGLSPDLERLGREIESEVQRRRPHGLVIADPLPVDVSEWASSRTSAHERRAQALAAAFIDGMARLYRRVAALGSAPVIHAGLSDAAATLRMAATQRCTSTRGGDGEIAIADTWVLRHAVFFVALSEQGVCERVLPRHFESAALRRRRSLDMMSTLQRLEQVVPV